MARPNIKTRSGNRVVIKFDGKEIGAAQSVSMEDDYAPEPSSGIGDIHVLEYVPTIARHVLNVEQMVLYNASMRKAGIATENGDSALEGLVFDVESFSKDDGTLIRKYTGCSYAGGSLEIRKHAIVMARGRLNAIDTTGTEA